MSTIDRLNGVTATDIASVDNHNASAIASINGQSLVTASFLLDTYGANIAAAYSVRKLSSSYTGAAIRVRETSGNTEADIGFDSNGNLDESALTSHVGANSGYIVKWYDQSGNGNDVTQLAGTRQMWVVAAGTVKKLGTKVAPEAFTSRTYYSTATAIAVTPPQTTVMVLNPTVTGGNYHAMGEDLTGTYRFGGHNDRLYLNGGSLISTADGAIAQPHMIAVGLTNGASSYIRANGSELATGNTSGNSYFINSVFGPVNSTSNMRGNMQEVLIYTADKSTDIAAIETDINTYFSIYP